MKTIGLLGGMSWESTALYYKLINETVREKLGGLHSARIVLYSVDFAQIEEMQRSDRWNDAGALLGAAARAVERGGADFLLICTNTMHAVADRITENLRIPLLHIADATADELEKANVRSVGLLGTRFTMEKDFYRQRLGLRGFDVVVPDSKQRDDVHRIIYDELVLGRIEPKSRQRYRQVITGLVDAGADAIIFGCTEICLLIGANDSPVPVFDTTAIHARAAAELALSA